MDELIISKLDAARRQLEMAIRIYFNEGDPVSIHTLAAAAYNVLRDINAKRGGAPMLIKDGCQFAVKPEHLAMFKKKLNEAENFFKHADDDPDETIKFNPGITEYFLLDACDKYRSLTKEIVPNLQVFFYWFVIQNPELFNQPPEMAEILVKMRSYDTTNNRAGYYAMALPILSQMHL